MDQKKKNSNPSLNSFLIPLCPREDLSSNLLFSFVHALIGLDPFRTHVNPVWESLGICNEMRLIRYQVGFCRKLKETTTYLATCANIYKGKESDTSSSSEDDEPGKK